MRPMRHHKSAGNENSYAVTSRTDTPALTWPIAYIYVRVTAIRLGGVRIVRWAALPPSAMCIQPLVRESSPVCIVRTV